jgi:putative nucleotidyltransferase with HDIG domain
MHPPAVQSDQVALDRAKCLLRQASSLPPAPLVGLKLWRVLNSEDARRDEVTELVRYDARLCALILRIANSAMYGRGNVRSIDQAVLSLGSQIIAQAVSALIGKSLLVEAKGCYRDPVMLWRHSVTSAVASSFLSIHATRFRVDGRTAYTAALLHDIGTSVIAHSGHSDLPALVAFQSERRCGWSEAEAVVLGADHADVGAALLRAWDLPDEIVTAVGLHHAPDQDPSGLAGVVHLASLCAEVAADPQTRRVLEPALTPLLIQEMGFGSEIVQSTLDHLGTQLELVEALVGA